MSGVGGTAVDDRQDSDRPVAAGSYEVTPSDGLVSGKRPSQADESSSGTSIHGRQPD